ncbi:nucleoside/nucleotide kinase family protein [Demequina sediminicola]|uniref:nucleoside/nucleotide kinase family protein n=1 Tax=Demequina sediminicola TaxID=1095026 RepID=UPI00191C3843|nr:nucleoside/nucleotide kinase family protein [Demequina sediminicola]
MDDQSPSVPVMTLEQAQIRAAWLAEAPQRVVIGLVGAPGSGKSTVSDHLTASLLSAVAVPMDGFHFSNEVLRDLGRRQRKGAPDTFDVAGYVALLQRLRADAGVVYAPRFDRSLEESIGSAIAVAPECRVVVTEGNYLLAQDYGWDAVRSHLDEVWYLDVPRESLVKRLVARRVSHGHPEAEARAWVDNVDSPNIDHVVATAHKADFILTIPEAQGAQGEQ